MTDSALETGTREQVITENISRVRDRIARAVTAAGLKDNAVTLCAVTKTRPVSDVLAAVRAGISDIGENYVQEAREKIPAVRAALPAETPLLCHLIGHLQNNKVKYVIDFAQVIHSVDSEDLLQEIAKRVQKLYNVATRMQVLIEVNLTGDAARAGISPEKALDLAARANEIPGIELSGLMGMAPAVADSEDARPYFARLRKLFDALPEENRQILSMGMSGDFEAAIAEGATLVRVGTAIFGHRT